MLKPKERLLSSNEVLKFIGHQIADKEVLVVDVCVLSSLGKAIYYEVPCAIEQKYFSHNEKIFSVDIWWTQAKRCDGNRPEYGYPSEPYKSCFNYFHYNRQDKYLDFRNIWKEEVRIFIFNRDEECNELKIDKIMQRFE